ncbi:LysM peptidoglycan-binding domain-containing protein [Filobacillus milosensis]|uniref:LysM peptidoglycan-binding domain-containing protein n=1 Tax=Filobacillus milosensis TaxID=94137 RepID=A0A4Y8IT03_9BACI|nr:LysM peptidoglycan-binding domain-containing protein [Filobacillus milosensis]TFB24922.1 LysM peptidoglycan-binding domain-containing protein [Filobacillus milosensis]
MRIHVVQKGETFESIAKAYDLTVDQLIQMNRHLDRSNVLLPQMKVKVPLNVQKSPKMSNNVGKKIDVSNKRLSPPHDPNKPKVLPIVAEDEYVMSDKLISAIDDDQEDEFIQQFLPEGYYNWQPDPYAQPVMYDYHIPVQVMEPIPYENEPVRNSYYNPYEHVNQYAYFAPYYPNYNYMYRPYNPCGCGGYYY